MIEFEKKASRKPVIHILDGLILLCFAAYAMLFFLGKWDKSRPYIDISSDMAINIAGSAAVMDHPQLLTNDPVLGNPANIQFYLSAHIPLTRLLARWLGDDYGSAIIFPLVLHVFLQLCGFYILGRVIFKNRFWAVLLAALTAITVTLSLGEYWGVYSDPQPRFTFQVFLPFLLAAAYYWRDNVKIQPLLMIGVGCLIYVHSVSAPLWALALWLGFWLYLPKSWGLPKRIGFMLLNGLIFLAVALSFIWNYLGGRNPVSAVDVKPIIAFMLSVYPNYFRPWLDFQQFIAIFAEDALLWPGLIGLVVLIWLKRNDFRALGMVTLWIAGIILVSVIIPTAEVTLFRNQSQIPFTVILVRGLRYLVPFLMLFCLWPLAELSRRLDGINDLPWRAQWATRLKDGLSPQPIRYTLTILGVFIVLAANVLSDAGYQSGRSLQWRLPAQALACLRKGHLTCPITPAKVSQIDILHYISKELPPGAAILPILAKSDKQYSLELAVRYAALHPVVFTDKDFSTYWQSNPAALIQWQKDAGEIEQIQKSEDLAQRTQEALVIAKRLSAAYLLLDWQMPEDALHALPLIYKNKDYAIYAMQPVEP